MASRRRTSSVGKIDLGDSVPGLAAQRTSKRSHRASASRVTQLSSKSSTDSEILSKIKTAYVELSYRHTWLTPFMILVVVYGAYFSSGNYTESNPLHMFVAISYQLEEGKDVYAKGWKDLCFVFYYMIFFTFLREFVMQCILRPLASVVGVKKPGKVKRFMEQAYSIFYYGISGPFGLYVMYGSDLWLFRTDTMYKTYPDITTEWLYKLFYLGQAAFWSQQSVLLILQVEKPRKDYHELIMHHIVTMLLIGCSYQFHFQKMGLAVYITMDVSDFFLAVSKVLNYLDSPFIGPWFALFVGSWIYLRHWVNLRILWSVLTEFKTIGPYTLNFATQQYKCWISQTITFILIGALQLVNIYWLVLILRIVYRFVFGLNAKDDRSDSEDEDQILDEHENIPESSKKTQ
ncbi:Sphingosine N-acyltransferase LAG1 [Cyberlindnera fabianii]|uniref:Sphingosine N-acyltransferase LAG1 n=1 Tax=Cyberlindnera fabianii TaxID=36022 RepID=A0A1V2L3Y8_CYBFA|nr:Sphingosine N-acyltransferase LAG1 [Cyberlindnera fabianii]